MQYRSPRGTVDILPNDQPYWEYVQEKTKAVARRFGYRRIDTPIFEETGLFLRSVGEVSDIVEKEMYSFADKGGDDLTLRPEATAPICRAYVEHGMRNLPQPVRLYTAGPMFRYDRPQAGRYRQFHQVNWEVIGDPSPSVDAEVIDTAWQLYADLGLAHLRVDLNSIGCRECRPGYLKRLVEYYEPRAEQLCRDCLGRLGRNPLRLLDCKIDEALKAEAPRSVDALCAACARHHELLIGFLEAVGIPFVADHRLVRGLDYYTRTVFEVIPEGAGGQGTIGGGGRYDGLIEEIGGPPTPAIGFATGIERIILNLKAQEIAVPDLEGPRVYVAHVREAAAHEAVVLLARLRRAGVPAVGSHGERSLKAQLRQANTFGAAWAVILGEEELRAGEATLRDLATSAQHRVPIDRVVAELSAV